MPALQASRRLVKSPPELWAEVSDAASLARHLGEVGEITITRLEPETTVAWEGERASGTVELAPAGWGTAVTLTAERTGEDEESAEAVAEAVAPVAGPAVVEPEPEPVVTAEPTAEPIVEPDPAPAAPRRGWLARLFARRSAPAPAPEPAAAAPSPEPDPAPPPPEEPVAEQPPDPLADALTSALDSLGSAHHRPFSRG